MKSEAMLSVMQMQSSVTSRADPPAPVPLFSAGTASAFGAQSNPPSSSNTGASPFPGGREGNDSATAQPTLWPASRLTPGRGITTNASEFNARHRCVPSPHIALKTAQQDLLVCFAESVVFSKWYRCIALHEQRRSCLRHQRSHWNACRKST